MRIISLEPFITQTLTSLGVDAQIVGIGAGQHGTESVPSVAAYGVQAKGLAGALAHVSVDLKAIASLAPDRILTRLPVADELHVEETLAALQKSLDEELVGRKTKLCSYHPVSLDGVYDFLATCGKDVGAAERGRSLGSRMKAQFMDWGDNFYERMKNKKVTVISSVDPLRIAGWWVGDLIRIASAHPQPVSIKGAGSSLHIPARWDDVCSFGPDVIVVALEDRSLEETVQSFGELVALKGWDTLPAVKRGEVVFASGQHMLYEPTTKLLDGMGILVSAIAGFDSGYITPRDSFYRLRYVELQRHKLLNKR